MKILWFTWKDIEHPNAGGAEVVAKELAKRLAGEGHEVLFITSRYKGSKPYASLHGYKVVRVGGRYRVYWAAYRYYQKHLKGWADLVIDETNTIPFFAKFYVREPNLLLVHQLCRKIWFYELPLPLSWLGFVLEPLYLRLLADRTVITVSDSTKQDLLRYGYHAENIHIISEGIEIKPIRNLGKVQKYPEPTVLSLGAMRSMKRTLEQIRAFEKAKPNMPELKLKVAGSTSGGYGRKVLRAVAKSPYRKDIEVLGKVSQPYKQKLLKHCHAILVTSVKEGWGLIVTEAASQGTPAVVYDTDGLRDSVRNEWSGLIATDNTPSDLAIKVTRLLKTPSQYNRLREHAWQWSKDITFDKSYQEFREVVKL